MMGRSRKEVQLLPQECFLAELLGAFLHVLSESREGKLLLQRKRKAAPSKVTLPNLLTVRRKRGTCQLTCTT